MTPEPAVATPLAQREHWDAVHEHESLDRTRARGDSAWRRSKRALKRLLGSRLVAAISNYDDYLLWETILPQVLAGRRGQRAVEVGSAPGEFLVKLRDRFGLDVYGIEYSAVGAELNRAAFRTAGIPSQNVIAGDFFAIARERRYRGFFDVVISRGFIEHFTDPSEAIDRHLDVLSDDGILIVSVPNLRGLNFLGSWVLDRKVVGMHNLSIMARDSFEGLFVDRPLDVKLCRYYGTFNLCVFNTRSDSPLRPLLRASQRLQPALNVAFRTMSGYRSFEHKWSSPNLIFIGRKTPMSARPSAPR